MLHDTLLCTITAEDGQLLTCGNNDKGQLCLGHEEEVTVLQPVTVPGGHREPGSISQPMGKGDERGSKIAKATGGWDFTLLQTG